MLKKLPCIQKKKKNCIFLNNTLKKNVPKSASNMSSYKIIYYLVKKQEKNKKYLMNEKCKL